MILNEITEVFCPTCGATPVAEEKHDKHTNGHWNESRTFSCGLKLTFSPNYMRTSASKYYVCEKDPKTIADKKRTKEANKKLVNYIHKLDAPDEYKENIIDKANSEAGIF